MSSLSVETIEMIKKDLLALPFVQWDRFWENEGGICVFGWIKRPDTHEDYVELRYNRKDDQGNFDFEYSTSSAKYSKEIGRLLGFTGHVDCRRVEWEFNIPNMIKLERGE